MNNELFNMWKQAESPVEYMIVAYIWLLVGVATISWMSIVFLLLTEPERFSKITFGLIDYI